MADIYDSEEEQLDALRRWWKENGLTVIVGLVVGLGGVFGWTAWQGYQQDQQEGASALYQRQANATASRDFPTADKAASELMEQYPSSGYAGLSALVMAKSAFEQGRTADAKRHLQGLMGSTGRLELKLTARLRLARIMLSEDEHDGALALLNADDLGTFEPAFDELRGDVFVAASDVAKAKQAYEEALNATDDPSADRRRVQLKLNDLGHTNITTD